MKEIAKNYKLHFGIDVSKDRLDIHCLEENKFWQIENKTATIKQFLKENTKQLQSAFIVIDMAGGYEKTACDLFITHSFSVHRAHPYRVKSYIRACGQLSKTDAIDAKMLAQYGKERKDKLTLYQSHSKHQLELKALVERRFDLIKMQTAEKNRLQAPTANSVIIKTCKAVIKVLQSQIKMLETKIDELIKSDEKTSLKAKVLETITGIGPQTIRSLIAIMPELGNMNAKQAASLAGLAPRANESGSRKGYRFIKGGRPLIRRIMFMAALVASRYDEKLSVHYQKMIKNGKKPIVAIIAIARKIIVIANAKIRDEVIKIN